MRPINRDENYYMPAEWEPKLACVLLYPHNTKTFRDIKCQPARLEVRNIARAICYYGHEDVFLCCKSTRDADELKEILAKEEEGIDDFKTILHSTIGNKNRQNKIVVAVCDSDDSWCRDTGPTFVKDTITNELVGLHWNFNAYGGPDEGCYWPCEKDCAVAPNIVSILANHYSIDRTSTISIRYKKVNELVLEGGSFHTDGEGTILTTEECLLNKNRNPNLSKEQIEKIVLEKLGASKMIWLPHGIAFDEDTNGHIDNIATFARPGEIVLSWTNDVNDENYIRCKAAEDLLLNTTDAKGRSIKVHRLHLPDPMYYTNEEAMNLKDRNIGQRLAGSYVNYYLANDAVILPQFGDEKYDNEAIDTMKTVFPDKDVIGVLSREVLLGGGNIHCITQQVPNVGK